MRLFRTLVMSAWLFAALPALAAEDTATPPRDAVGAPAETTGIVIGTIGYRAGMKETKMDSASIVFRKVGSTDEGTIRFTRAWAGMGGPRDLKEGSFRFASFRMVLPEGQYELIRVTGEYQANPVSMQCYGDCQYHYGNKTDFSVPFVVERGKTLYLGSFLAHGTVDLLKIGFIPLPFPSTVYFQVADKWERDRALFGADAADARHASLAINARTGYYLIAEDQLPEPKLQYKDLKSGRASFAGKIAEYRAAHPDEAEPPPALPAAATHSPR